MQCDCGTEITVEGRTKCLRCWIRSERKHKDRSIMWLKESTGRTRLASQVPRGYNLDALDEPSAIAPDVSPLVSDREMIELFHHVDKRGYENA